MDIGVIKEIKNRENRVALTPEGAQKLIQSGHSVSIQESAGEGSGFLNSAYQAVGCQIVPVDTAWDQDLVLKIKEPMENEYQYLKQQILFTYFHLAGVDPVLTRTLLDAGTTAIAYETVENDQGKLPLLAPMSAVAGNMAVTIGSYYLAEFNNGKGIQLGTVLGKRYGKVMVLGDGVVGRHAAKVATAMGASVVMMTKRMHTEDELKQEISTDLHVVQSSQENIASELPDSDLLVGAVLAPGSKAPQLVSSALVATMQRGSVIVDVSIDQGGCIETARPTSHSEPVYLEHDVIHYCVTNMPGAYPRTSTIALTNATLGYVQRLACGGLHSLKDDLSFSKGVNTHQGFITYKPVAQSLDMLSNYKALCEIIE